MKEELTTLMHSEFQVDKDTEIKHMVWALLSRCKSMKTTIEQELDGSILTKEQVEKHKKSYFDLFK